MKKLEVRHDEARHLLLPVDVIFAKENCFTAEAVVAKREIERLVECQDLKPGDMLGRYEVPRG